MIESAPVLLTAISFVLIGCVVHADRNPAFRQTSLTFETNGDGLSWSVRSLHRLQEERHVSPSDHQTSHPTGEMIADFKLERFNKGGPPQSELLQVLEGDRFLSLKDASSALVLPSEVYRLVRTCGMSGFLVYLCCLLLLTLVYSQLRGSNRRSNQKAARFSVVATGEVQDDRMFEQEGFSCWALGSSLQAAFVLVPFVSQLFLIVLTIDQYLGAGWDETALTFIFIAVLSHVALLAVSVYTSALKTFFKTPCDLKVAEYVLIKEADEAIDETSERKALLGRTQQSASTRSTLVPIQIAGDGSGLRFYEYTCVRYIWNSDAARFSPVGQLAVSGSSAHAKFSGGGLTSNEAANLKIIHGLNQIQVRVPGVCESLWIEFFDFVYIFQLFAVWVYMFYSAWNYACLWFLIVFGIGALKCLFIVRQNQIKIRDMSQAGNNRLQKVLREKVWIDVKSIDLVVGDIVQVSEGVLCADVALLAGSVVVNETMLTGEPMPVQKIPMDATMDFIFDATGHGKKHGLFTGTVVMQSIAESNRPTQQLVSDEAQPVCGLAVGIVVGTGGRTMEAQLIRMVLFPSVVKFKYTEQLPIVYAMMVLWSMVLFSITMGIQDRDFSIRFLTWGCFLIQCLNPMLPVSLTMGQSVSAKRLENLGVTCLSLGRIPIAGKIVVMISDKTGTITHGGMDLCAVVPIASDMNFGAEVAADKVNEKLAGDNLLLALASCHTVTTLRDGTLVGNAVETSTMKAVGWKLSEPGQARTIQAPDAQEKLEVLRQLEFDHHRMTSGAVVRCETNGKTLLFVKGAYDKVEKITAASTMPRIFRETCERYAKQCYYVLAMCSKEFRSDAQDVVNMPRDVLESDLQFSGLILFRNEMKPDSPEAIAQLTQGGIMSVMCTGDNASTGLSIAKKCGIITNDAKVLVGDFDTSAREVEWRNADTEQVISAAEMATGSEELVVTQAAFRFLLRDGDSDIEAILPRIKVFGRMKPDDKVKVITLWQGYNGQGRVTGMVGDGGNDCGALRVAHAGIALSEAEASMVSPFSSRKGLDDKGYMSLTAVVDLIAEGRACLATNMATFMLFMVYGLVLTSSRLVLVVLGDMTFSEWHFLTLDFGISTCMVWAMSQCNSVPTLAARRPTSSLLGPRTVTCIALMIFIYWLFAGLAVIELMYGSGRDFYQPFNSVHIEVPGEEWTKKGDNFLSAVFFLMQLAVISSVAYVFSYGDIFRKSVAYNIILTLVYLGFLALVFKLVWSTPGDLNCVFRINCDNAHSKRMSLPVIQKVSTGNVGGGFLGPQLISCHSSTQNSSALDVEGLCWVVPPNDLKLPRCWLCEEPRPKAPFNSYEDKRRYCKQHPYTHGQASDLGNIWCFYPQEANDYEPSPSRPFAVAPPCVGPNTCFSDSFRKMITIIISGCIASIHVAYAGCLFLFGRFGQSSSSIG